LDHGRVIARAVGKRCVAVVQKLGLVSRKWGLWASSYLWHNDIPQECLSGHWVRQLG